MPDTWWSPIVPVGCALLGAAIGCSVPIWWSNKLRRLERRGEITAMLVELDRIEGRLKDFVGAEILAPLYEFPISITVRSLPKLIGDGLLVRDEINILVLYQDRVEELNRGLSRALQAHAAEPAGGKWLNDEYGRNILKAGKLLNEPMPDRPNVPLIALAKETLKCAEGKYRPSAEVIGP